MPKSSSRTARLTNETVNLATGQNSNSVTLGQASSLFDRRVKMNTSRKLVVKLRRSPKHRHAARKTYSTEAAQDETEPEQSQDPQPRFRPSAGGVLSQPALCSLVLNLFVFGLSRAVRPKIICRTQFVHLHISEPTPGPSDTQSQTTPGISYTQSHQPTKQKRSSGAPTTGIVENFTLCLSNSPSEIWPNIHLIFYPERAAQRKGNAKLPSMSCSKSTVDTSSSDGKDEKGFFLPDYSSEELTSSESSQRMPSPRISERAGERESPRYTHSYFETT